MKRAAYISACALFFCISLYLGFVVERVETVQLLTGFALQLILGVYIFYLAKSSAQFKIALFLGIGIRFAFVFSEPNLSDDIYRFIWDGELALSGVHPLAEKPSDFHAENTEFRPELFQNLNSKEYYTVYPPLKQAVFIVAALGSTLQQETVFLKALLFLGELWLLFGCIKLLLMLNLKPRTVLLYWLHPLAIIEIVGNCHFEGLMTAAFIWAIVLFSRKSFISGGFLAASILLKLFPIVFVPLFLLKNSSIKKFFLSLGVTLLVCCIPLFYQWEYVQHFLASINLYNQSFEFNASLYYVLRWLGYQYSGYNMISTIGPLLKLIFILSCFVVFAKHWKSNLQTEIAVLRAALFITSVYLLTATTVHPWYCIPILVCGIFARYTFSVVWASVTLLSYHAYAASEVYEQPLILVLEYSVLTVAFIFDFIYKPIERKKSPGMT